MGMVSFCIGGGESIWVTSLRDEADSDSYTLVFFRNLEPNVQVCRNDLVDVMNMPCGWVLV